MAVLVETPPRSTIPRPKDRFLKGLARHASAPNRPRLTLGILKPSESQRRVSGQRSLPSPRSSAVSPRPESNLLNELAITHAVVSRLRFERDDWRNVAQIQGRELLASRRDERAREGTIAGLENDNATLHAAHDGNVSTNNSIFACFQDAMTKHNKLLEKLNEQDRALARLKRSDRAKGKVWQRNLRLKTTLQRYASEAISGPAQPGASTESSLLEALASAAERIEELESTGAVLLASLEQRNDSCGSEDGEDDSEAKLLEAEVVFRGVIEDETFQEQKDIWKDIWKEMLEE